MALLGAIGSMRLRRRWRPLQTRQAFPGDGHAEAAIAAFQQAEMPNGHASAPPPVIAPQPASRRGMAAASTRRGASASRSRRGFHSRAYARALYCMFAGRQAASSATRVIKRPGRRR